MEKTMKTYLEFGLPKVLRIGMRKLLMQRID